MDALERLGKKSIRATDIAAQYWCEKQMELNYLKGPEITKEILKGKEIHEELENEANVPVVLQTKSYADFMYKSLYTTCEALETLKKNNRSRELLLYGSLGRYKVVGKMDELLISNGSVVIVEDKTRATDNMPSEAQTKSHRAQVMLYKKLLSDILSGEYNEDIFSKQYGIARLAVTREFERQLDALQIPKHMQNLVQITEKFFKSYRSLGKLSDTLVIRYINQFTGKKIDNYKFKASDEEVRGTIDFALKYWKGEREALPVPYEEKWKCEWCAFFGKECKVWFPQRTLKAS
ncbi:MAG: exonuclease V [Candidatus Marsarchaeota archaeon]|nr:exonuclease V [Candidatus Marsarchaeota archaeon]MCL5102103.1 exonuclease V [Candidatus Marsarchaeota archaeon]